jgi:hypothetical protein
LHSGAWRRTKHRFIRYGPGLSATYNKGSSSTCDDEREEAVMTDAPTANEGRQRAHAREASVQTYARIAGALFLISLVAGGFSEFFVPSTLIVSADATATAKNI